MDSTTLNTISLCSGVGMLDEGVHAGLEFLGIRSRTVMFAEREAWPVNNLVARMEEGSLAPAPIWFGDITELPAERFRGLVDGVVAGFPCQDLSVAGRRAGLDGKRSGLFFNVCDIADESGAWFMLLENVAGIASASASVVDEASTSDYAAKPAGDGFSDVGIEDGMLLERAAARVMGELADRGWNAEWITLSASDVGASHGRARWFCFCWRLADAGLQYGELQQRRARAEHSGGGIALDDSQLSERRAQRFGRTCGIQGHDSGRAKENCGTGIADQTLDGAEGIGRIEGRAESTWQQGRSYAAEYGGAVADAGSAGLPQRVGRGGGFVSERMNQTRGQTLSFIAAHSSPQAQAIPDGQDCLPDSPGLPQPSETKRLNPYFVEWLMGWPAGWTSPTVQPDYAPAAMASYRSAQQAQLSCLFTAPAFSKEAAINPTTIQFRAQPAVSCRGCLFEPEHSATCKAACIEAAKRGLPDCDDAKGYIYVADEVDPRQLALIGADHG